MVTRKLCHSFFLFGFFALVSTIPACRGKNTRLLAVKSYGDFPSGSGLAVYKNMVYVVGDDATDMMVVDKNLNASRRIPLFESRTKRIPKDVKPDLESGTILHPEQKGRFLLTGSGSLSPSRDICVIMDSAGQQKQYSLTLFYDRLRKAGLTDLNIEGAAMLPAGILLASRGNKTFLKNFLILTNDRFWENQEKAEIKMIRLGGASDTSLFSGVSGLDYSYRTDQLFITLSTEDTRNSYEDGAIGKSYLWIVNEISAKIKWSAINPDRIIDLEEIDPRFAGNKIESVAVIVPEAGKQELILVSDDDKGGTVLFRLAL